MEGILEGLLFVQGDNGLSLKEVMSILNLTEEDAKELIYKLKKSYENENRGLRLNYLGNTFKLTTKQEHKAYYQKLIKNEETNRLSQSSLETLSIIAYNEPISRIDIDEIRGVSSGYIIRKLLLKGLMEEKGKSDAPGKPTLYGVTNIFLDYFGLGSTKDLPKIENKNNNENNKNTYLFETKYTENN